jgi:uncharacterized membrane protein
VAREATPDLHSEQHRKDRHRRFWAIIGLVIVSLVAFLLAPWSLQDKTIAALHGLCAQQPTHSFWFGDYRLPFDARMTGIYGAFLIVSLYLLARGRLFRTGVPPTSIIVALAGFIFLMAFDGVNSTLNDVGLPYLYEPSNHLRFFTGALTGTTLALFTWLLLTSVLWSPEVTSPKLILRSWKELAPVAGFIALLWAVIQTGIPLLFAPLAIALVISAVVVIASLALVVLAMVGGRFQRSTRPSQLTGHAVVAVLIAYAVMSAIAGARVMLEAAVSV